MDDITGLKDMENIFKMVMANKYMEAEVLAKPWYGDWSLCVHMCVCVCYVCVKESSLLGAIM